MFEKILVPLDGSQLSQRALEPALVVCRQVGAELLLVRVPTADTLSFAVSEAKQRALAQDALAYLETIRTANEQPQFNIRAQCHLFDAGDSTDRRRVELGTQL